MNAVKTYTTIHFAIKFDRCVGSCNALNDWSNTVCVPKTTEDLNIHVFINESKVLRKNM